MLHRGQIYASDGQIIHIIARATEIGGVEQDPPIYPVDAELLDDVESGYSFVLTAITSNGQPLANDVVVDVSASPSGLDFGVDYNFFSTGLTIFEDDTSGTSLNFGVEILGIGESGTLAITFSMVSGGILLDADGNPTDADSFTITLSEPMA